MSNIIREPRLEATKFFKYQIEKNALCIHEFFKRVSALQWSLSAFVKYIAKLETGLGFEQLFKVFVKSLDQICVLFVVPACVRAFAQNYLKWLEDTVNVTAQAEAYRAYITAPAVPTKSSTSFSEDQLPEYHTQQTDRTYTGDESDRGTDEDVQER
ncbi:16359_t:CDS:2, partial [Acaulospora morrowiae]